ncbi:MAG TPA: PAS domain S-box protein, partial [Planctomycetota bacterium]|nr:PAS domain S-box protein [Planctomycetota bacterium]
MSKDPVNILLVDDQPAKLLSYEVILSELGENLIKASSGNEALNHLLRTEVAVVLVDVCMPGLDGFELAKMISEHPRLQNTAIILISAVFMSDLDRLKGYHSGAVDYVPVPIIPEVLRAKVRVFAELYRVTKQLRELNAELERRVEQRTAALEASTAELRRSEELFRLVTETIPSMVWIATPEGHISYANRRWHEYSGLPATGDGLRWPDEHVHPDDQARWRSLWTTTEPEQRSVEIEVRKRRHDGVYRWFLVRAVPRRAADGRVVAWFGVSTDIQEKKAMEERLRDADRRKDEFLA